MENDPLKSVKMGSSRLKWPTLAGNSSFSRFFVVHFLRKVWKMVCFFEKLRKWSTESVENCQLFLRKCVKWPTLAGNSSFLGFLLQKAWKIVIFLDVANQLRKVWKMVYFFEKCVKWTTLVGIVFMLFVDDLLRKVWKMVSFFWENVANDLQKVWKIIYFLWESV